MKQLTAALLAAQSEIPTIAKDAQGHGYKYMSLDVLTETLRPILARHGLAVMQFPARPSHPGNIALKTIVMHESGESIEEVGELPMQSENGRMNASQAAGAAYRYLRRYSLAAVFGVIDGEDTDAATLPNLPANVTTAEAEAISKTPAAQFPTIAAALSEDYTHEKHVLNSLKLLGYASIPGKPEERIKAFSELKERKNGHGASA